MQIVSGGLSDVGRVRSNNEDCYRIVPSMNLFVLSDGMGGEAHGEIASALAVETVVKYCLQVKEDPTKPANSVEHAGWCENTKHLANAVRLANQRICQSAEEHPEQRGMGATLTVAWIEGNKLSIAHIGDSRAYLLRGGNLQQLTTDHSLVAEQVRRGILTAAEAEQSEMQSVLLRALGSAPEVEVDAEEHEIFERDVLLLCSDGLTRMVTEPEIAGALQAEPDPAKSAAKLVELANESGGADNITVMVARADAGARRWFSWLRRKAPKHADGNGSAGGK